MNLTFHMIRYQLQKLIGDRIHIYSRNPEQILVGRPIIYETDCEYSGHSVLIQAEKLKKCMKRPWQLRNSLFFCFGNPSQIDPDNKIDILLVDDTLSVGELLNNLQKIYNLFDQWDNSMRQMIYDNCSYDELIENCSSVSDLPLALCDADFVYVAYSHNSNEFGLVDRYVDTNHSLPLELTTELVSDPMYENYKKQHTAYEYSLEENMILFHINLYHEDTYIGWLSIIGGFSEESDQYHKEILFYISLFIERLYHKRGTFHNNKRELNNLQALLKNILDQQIVSPVFWSKVLDSIGWKETDLFQLIQLRASHRYENLLHACYLCAELEERWAENCVIEFHDKIVILLNLTRFQGTKDDEFFGELSIFLRENLLTGSISRPFHGQNNVLGAYQQTECAFTIGQEKDPTYWYYRFDDYVLDYLLQNGQSEFTKEQICAPSLLKLIEIDQETGTEYYKTLKMYVTNGFNATHSAEKLYIHRSTFLNRMERIQELTHVDLDDFRTRTYLQISCLLLETPQSREE